MNEPLVSVIISCYNHEKYIGDAIDSVMKQTYKNIELIITDDGSTDRSREIIKNKVDEWRSDFEVKLLLNETNTSFLCVEEAYNNARGKYISGIGGDDMLKPDKILRQVEFLENNQDKYSLCFTWVECIGNDPGKVSFFKELFNINNESKPVFLKKLLFKGNFLNAPSFMMRKDIFDELGGYDFSLRQVQDYILWVNYLLSNDLYIIPEELTIYRVVEGSVSDQKGHPDVTARTFEETVCTLYETVLNMEGHLFNELFPDDNAENQTDLDIMCRKFLCYYTYAKSNSNLYPGEIAVRLYYHYRHVQGFTDLLKKKYNISRIDMYDFTAKYTSVGFALQKDDELAVYKAAHENHRFDLDNIGKNDIEIVNEILDVIDDKTTIDISLDHIVALYDFCMKNGNSMDDFISIISGLRQKNKLFSEKKS